MADYASLIGTPSRLTILDDDGNTIVKEGEVITRDVVRRAQDSGRMDDLAIAAQMSSLDETDLVEAAEFEEIGVEDPEGVHPESG